MLNQSRQSDRAHSARYENPRLDLGDFSSTFRGKIIRVICSVIACVETTCGTIVLSATLRFSFSALEF